MSIQPYSSNPHQRMKSSPRPAATVQAVVAPTQKPSLLWLAMFVAAALLVVFASRASAQYDSIPMHKQLVDEAAVKAIEASSKAYLLSGQGSKNSVIGYFQYYVPAKMTDPEGVKHISELSQSMLGYLSRVQRANRPDIAKVLQEAVYKGMLQVATGNHHPAARISAVVILSRLDSKPADNSTKTPPVPLAEVLPTLVSLYTDESIPDGVRAAALQGIHRHVMYSPQLPADKKTEIQTAMTSLLEGERPADRDPTAHAYLQRFAVDILDLLRPASDSGLGEKLVSISTDPDKHSMIALYSAAKLGQMGNEMKNKIAEPDAVLSSWGKLAYQALREESARLKALERPKPDPKQPKKPEDYLKKAEETPKRPVGGMGGGTMDMDMAEMGGGTMMMNMEDMGGGTAEMMDMMAMGMGGMTGMGMTPAAKPQPPQVVASRRKINHAIQQLHLGVTGAATLGLPKQPGGLLATVGENKAPVEEWVTKMQAVMKDLNDPMHDDLKKYETVLKTQLEALRVHFNIEAEAVEGVIPADPADPADPAAPADKAADPADVVDELAPIAIDELAAP